jgi:hypothetical protein
LKKIQNQGLNWKKVCEYKDEIDHIMGQIEERRKEKEIYEKKREISIRNISVEVQESKQNIS